MFVETLDLEEIAKRTSDNKLGKSTYDNGWKMFLRMLDQELTERGKRLIRIDKWFPSTQICSRCGKRHTEMKNLNVREMECSCGFRIDRDVNAALNLRVAGICIVLNERWMLVQKKNRTVGMTGFAFTS